MTKTVVTITIVHDRAPLTTERARKEFTKFFEPFKAWKNWDIEVRNYAQTECAPQTPSTPTDQ